MDRVESADLMPARPSSIARRADTDSGTHTERKADQKRGAYDLVLTSFALLGLAYSVAVLVVGWRDPILNLEAFRQTQTAVNVRWLLRGSSWLAYQTPVLGPPWTYPFEFPIYQWTAALIATTGLPLEQSGRLSSWLYCIGGVFIAAKIVFCLTGNRRLALIFTTIFLFSPLYVFWSRAFMIESCANFFSLAFLWGVLEYVRIATGSVTPIRLLAVGLFIALFAVLGAVIKITTFFAFALAAGAVTLSALRRTTRTDRSLYRVFVTLAGPLFAVGVGLLSTIAWFHYTDELKLESPLSAHLTSTALRDWFISPDLIFSSSTWQAIVANQFNILGSIMPLPLTLLYSIVTRRSTVLILTGILLYMAPFLVFVHLHDLHDYYDYANGIFVILSVAAGIHAIGATRELRWAAPAAVILLTLVIAGQVYWFQVFYSPKMGSPPEGARTLAIADLVRRNTRPDDVVVVVGWGWSPEVGYYSDRRELALPFWSQAILGRTSPMDLRAWTGGSRIGAIVDCPGQGEGIPMHRWIAPAEAQRSAHAVADCRVYL